MSFEDLQTTIGIRFKDHNLLEQAFIHRSYLNEARQIKTSNERLEFLGDSVLSFITSHFLFARFPDFPEGTLTNIRSSLVKTHSLSQMAAGLGIGELLKLSRGEEEGGGRHNPSLLADAFEALLGAIYLDQGIEVARQFLERFLFPQVEQIVAQKTYLDYKSLLQETIQEKLRLSPTYRVIRESGPDHSKTFWVEALAGERVLGQGSGKSKQEAEQRAAVSALEKREKT